MKWLRFVFGSVYVVLILLLMLLMLRQCGRQDAPREDNAEEQARRTGGMGNLKVTLLWDRPGDVDLHVVEPSGKHIYFHNKHPCGSYGRLDFDNIPGGPGAVENIFWNYPSQGAYKLYIHYFSANGGGEIPCKVLVFKEGELAHEYTHTLRVAGERHDFPDIVVE